MRAVISGRVAYVEEIVGLRGLERRFERAETGGGDRPGREPANLARVVRRIAVEVALIDLPVIPPLARGLRSVDDRGVDAERGVPRKPVVDDRRDTRTLLGKLRLGLD